MKKIFTIAILFVCSLLFAESYTITAIIGANGSKGRAKGKGGALTVGQIISSNDIIKVNNGNVVYLDGDKEIRKSGKVKDVIEKRKIQ